MSASEVSTMVDLYRTMLLIRRFEESVVKLVNSNEIPGITHEYIGEEAVAAGVMSCLVDADRITSTHRGHGHAIARGVSLHAMFAELMAKATGPNRGRGGSMHVTDTSVGHLGANGIVGASAPIACGAAFVMKQEKTGGIAVSFFGDGGINQGVLMESLNLARVWELPVLFVCENNGYAVSTPISQVSATELTDRAASFGLLTGRCDGMDVAAVAARARELVASVRDTGRPAFLECETYRFSGHHTAEAMQGLGYRTDDEIRQWQQRDPIPRARAWLMENGAENQVSDVDADVEAAMEDAIARARADAEPDVDTAYDFVYASGMKVEVGT